MGVQRLTYRRRLSYNTKSNKTKIVRTPGNRLIYHYTTKTRTIPKCGWCKNTLRGMKAVRNREGVRGGKVSRRKKTTARAYGGNMCPLCLRDRIIRAFLIEEQKIVVKVLKAQQATTKAAKKTTKPTVTKKSKK